MFEKGDVVKFRSKEELQALYDKLVVSKSQQYFDVVMSLANETNVIRTRQKSLFYKNCRYTLEGDKPNIRDDKGHWLFCEEFLMNAEDTVPCLFGV